MSNAKDSSRVSCVQILENGLNALRLSSVVFGSF